MVNAINEHTFENVVNRMSPIRACIDTYVSNKIISFRKLIQFFQMIYVSIYSIIHHNRESNREWWMLFQFNNCQNLPRGKNMLRLDRLSITIHHDKLVCCTGTYVDDRGHDYQCSYSLVMSHNLLWYWFHVGQFIEIVINSSTNKVQSWLIYMKI